MTTTAIPRTSSDLGHVSRAEQRKQRLLEVESEQAAEEAEALKMTEEQRQMLMKPFTSVKVEFSDLDGLRWTQTALRKFQPLQRHASAHVASSHHASMIHNTFVVLTNADLASFSPEDTIRVSGSTTKARPRFPSQPTVVSHHHASLFFGTNTHRRHRDGSRPRSPIKGLFPSDATKHHHDKLPSSQLEPHLPSPIALHNDVPYFEGRDSKGAGGIANGSKIPNMNNGLVSAPVKQGIASEARRQHPMGPPGLVPAPPGTYEYENHLTLSPFPSSVVQPAASTNSMSLLNAFPNVPHRSSIPPHSAATTAPFRSNSFRHNSPGPANDAPVPFPTRAAPPRPHSMGGTFPAPPPLSVPSPSLASTRTPSSPPSGPLTSRTIALTPPKTTPRVTYLFYYHALQPDTPAN
ncbi:hypothetical protein B0H34DRAFT_124236 [Crassisporium funariophilum]|nr:hypothetical protein B0H34DRAFT_124236 [Crassisporium funariophilum]